MMMKVIMEKKGMILALKSCQYHNKHYPNSKVNNFVEEKKIDISAITKTLGEYVVSLKLYFQNILFLERKVVPGLFGSFIILYWIFGMYLYFQ